MTIHWTSDFLLGIDAIDEQHREIFEHLLRLENAIAKKDPWHILEFFLAEVTRAVTFHLAVEEALLDLISFPHMEAHRSSHGGLAAALAALKKSIKSDPSATHLVSFFNEWFVRHVLQEDRQYADYARDRLALLAG